MRRADLLYRLLAFLRRRRTATARELAAHLEVSERTVYRDVADLVHSGVPLRGEAGVGYRLERSAELPPVMLDADEVQALVFGARLVERYGDPALRAAARSAVDKLAEVLPDTRGAWVDRTPLFAFPGRTEEATLTNLGTLRGAVAARRVASFAYADAEGRQTSRSVRPIGLWFIDGRWTLAAWCELRGDHRNFRVDRISALVVDERTFPDEPPTTVAAFVAAMRAQRPR